MSQQAQSEQVLVTKEGDELDIGTLMGTTPKYLPTVIGDLPSESGAVNREAFIDYDLLEPDAKGKVDQIVANFDLSNTSMVLLYAAESQKAISSYLDVLLGDVTVKELDVANAMLHELESSYDMLQVEKFKKQISGNENWFTRLLRKFKIVADYVKVFHQGRELVVKKLDAIQATSENEIVGLSSEIKKYDDLVGQVGAQMSDLGIYIAAGEMIREKAKQQYKEAAQQVKESRDPQKAAELQDMQNQLANFDVRLLRIMNAYVEASQVTIPEVRTTQDTCEIEMQNMSDSILFDLPAIKMLMTRLSSADRLRGAQAHRQRTENLRESISEQLDSLSRDVRDQALLSQGTPLQQTEALIEKMNKTIEGLRRDAELKAETRAKREKARNAIIAYKDEVSDAVNDLNIQAAESM